MSAPLDEAAVAAYVQQQLAPLQAQIARQQAQLALHHSASLPQSASASPSPPGTSLGHQGGKPLVKPKPPSTFAATDKVGELDQWEREMRYQFAAYGHALGSEEQRIAFAVSYLGAVPLQWWDADPTHQLVRTWDAFVALLRARFRPVHAAKQARMLLFRIKQSSAQTAGAYAAAFQQLLVSLPDMHVDDAVFLFVQGLLPSLRKRVGDKEFASLSAAINAAVQSEGLYGLQAGDEPAAVASASAGQAMDLNALSAQYAAVQEELHALKSSGGSGSSAWVPGVSKQLAAERFAAGTCLRCGVKGHFKNECPQPRK